MKKKIALFVLAVMLFCVSACGKQTNDADVSNTADMPNLKVWCIQSSITSDYATNTQSMWMEEKTGIQIDYIDVPQSGWSDSFKNYVMSGETADIYLYDFDTTEVSALVEMGGIIPLEDLISEYAPNIRAFLEENKELAEQLKAPDGHIYALLGKTYNQLEYSQKVYVNRDWLKQYEESTGKGLPETTDDLYEMLLYFKNNDMNGNGDSNDEIPMLGVSGVDAVYYLLGSFVIANSSEAFGCYSNDSGLTFAFNTDEFKEGLEYIKKLHDAGLYSADSFTIDQNSRYIYTSGKKSDVRVGVVSGADLSSVVQLSSDEDSMDYDSYVALPPVAGPKGVRTIVSRGSETIGMRGAISSTCTDPVTAIKWLDFCYSEEARLYSVYNGLEGEDWHYEDGETINGSGKIVVSDGEETENHSWQGDHCITYQITEDDFLMMDESSIGSNAALATYRANLAYRPYGVEKEWPPIAWAGEDQEAGDEYSSLYSAIVECVTDYYTSVILGTKDLNADWNSYISQLDSIGVNRYIELCKLYISKG